MIKININNIFNIIILITTNFLILLKSQTIPYVFKILLIIFINLLFLIITLKNFYKKQIIYRISLITYIFLIFIFYILFFFKNSNFFNELISVKSLKKYILSTGKFGILIYIMIQTIQVIVAPIPAGAICIVGSLIYGPFFGSLYCTIGIILGSFISFLIGKTFGYKVVKWIVGKENIDKYLNIFKTKGTIFLIFAFMFPLFPDDILCLIAGISKMKFKNFAYITIFTRPISILFMSYFGSGYIIPFTGIGIYIWIFLFIIISILAFISYKKQDKIQCFIMNKIIHKINKN